MTVTVQEVVAGIAALSIVNDCRSGIHESPTTDKEREQLSSLHVTRALQNLGLPRSECAPTHKQVDFQLRRHGGWGKSAQPVILQIFSNCLQCDEPNPLVHTHPGGRDTWRRDHEKVTGHVAVQRWEMPYAL